MNDEQLAMKAMSWALKGNHLRVYPIVDSETYTISGTVGKSKTKRQVLKHMVRLVIEIGNAQHVGEQLYRQDEQMTNKINEIYIHYYNKSHGSN